MAILVYRSVPSLIPHTLSPSPTETTISTVFCFSKGTSSSQILSYSLQVPRPATRLQTWSESESNRQLQPGGFHHSLHRSLPKSTSLASPRIGGNHSLKLTASLPLKMVPSPESPIKQGAPIFRGVWLSVSGRVNIKNKLNLQNSPRYSEFSGFRIPQMCRAFK